MPSFNRVILAGNLVRDVELKELGDDKVVADVPIAINEGYKDKQTVHYIDLTLWNQSAKFANNYLGKGSAVLVEGRLHQDRWEQEGKTRSKHKITVDKIVSLNKREDNPQGSMVDHPKQQADVTPLSDTPF